MPDRASILPSADAVQTRALEDEGRRLIAWTWRLRDEIEAAAEAGRRASRESSELLARLTRDGRTLPGERE